MEALRSGCIPVCCPYLPNAAAWLGLIVPTGGREQLVMALKRVIVGVARSADRSDESLLLLNCGMMSRYAFDKAAHAHAAQFSAKRIGNEMPAQYLRHPRCTAPAPVDGSLRIEPRRRQCPVLNRDQTL